MDCSICYEGITVETGNTTLSCSHSFHFRCLVKWFYSQSEKEINESCPCCRKKPSEHEQLPEEPEPSEAPQELLQEVPVDEYEVRLEALRSLAHCKFMTLKEIQPKEEFETYAAIRIQAAWRGYMRYRMLGATRMARYHHNEISYDERGIQHDIERGNNNIRKNILLRNFYAKSRGMNYLQWMNYLATKVQAAWRGHSARKIRISWHMIDNVWTRTVYSAIDPPQWLEGLPPQSLVFQLRGALQN